MKHIFNIKTLLFSLALGAGALMTSCDDSDDVTKADALFRPIVSETAVGGQWIELNWERYEGADYYDLNLTGKDGLDLSVETDTTFYRFENLNYDTDYTIKIRSHSKSSGLESKYFVVPTITTTDIPTQLKGVRAIDNMALVSWETATYTNLKLFQVVTPEGSTTKEEELLEDHTLTETDLNSQTVEFRNLEPESNYIVRAYNNGEYLGKKVFSTAAPEVYEGVVANLRNLAEEESYAYMTQSFFADSVAKYPDQDITIVLEGGCKYQLDGTITLPATQGTIKIVTGLSLKGNAIIEVNGNYNAEGAIGGFVAEKITFTEHPNALKTSSNFGGKYLFNLNKSGASIGKVELKSCDIKYKRGIFRIQTQATVENFIIDNCVVDSIGGYGVANANNDAADIKHIKVSNSSFSHCEKLFVQGKNANAEGTFSAANCTFVYNMKNGGNYMFDFSKQKFTEDPVLKDCVFGPGSNNGKLGAYAAFRAAKGSMMLDNCYGTSDIAWHAGADGTPVSAFDLKPAGGDVKSTFKDASKSDFTLLINDLKNVAGDPRWW